MADSIDELFDCFDNDAKNETTAIDEAVQDIKLESKSEPTQR